jgi:CHAT domain-containing protein
MTVEKVGLKSRAEFQAAVRDAESELRNGNFVAALDQYFEIVKGRLAGAEEYDLPVAASLGRADMIVIERLVDLARFVGYHDAAADLLEALSLLHAQAGVFYDSDYYLLKLIDLHLGLGDLDKARSLVEELRPRIGDIDAIRFSTLGLKEWEAQCNWPGAQAGQRRLLLSFLYLCLGRILAGYGQYADAIVTLTRGLAHLSTVRPDQSDQLATQFKLALAAAALEKGELRTSQEQLSALRPELKSDQVWTKVRWLELSGKLNQLLGRLSDARDCFAEVAGHCCRSQIPHATATALLNLSHILIVMNQTGIARGLIADASRLGTKYQASTLKSRAAFLLNMLSARSQSELPLVPVKPAGHANIEAQHSLAEASADFVEGPASGNYFALFEDRVVEFHWQLGRQNIVGAAACFARIQEVFDLSDSDLIRVRLQVLAGTLFYYNNEISEAERLLRDACVQLRALDLQLDLWQAQRQLSWCWRRLERPEHEIRQLTEDTEKLLSGMTEAMSASDQARFLLNKWTTEEEYIAGEVMRLKLMKQQLQTRPFYSRWTGRWSLNKELNRLLCHLDTYKRTMARRTLKGTAVNEDSASIPLWRRLWSQPRKRATVQFLVLPEKLLWIRSSFLSLDFDLLDVKRVGLRDLVQSWHLLVAGGNSSVRAYPGDAAEQEFPELRSELRHMTPMASPESPDDLPKKFASLSQQISDALQLPAIVQSLPRRVKSLSLVLDDVLHGFPFGAIKLDGQYLIERFAVSEAFSCLPKPAARTGAAPSALLVNVAVGSVENNIKPLPGTSREADIVGQWLAENKFSVRRLSDQAATRAAVLQALTETSFFHIACHGKFHPNRPDDSGLVLIPAADRIELLSFQELFGLDLTHVQHASLSSCWASNSFVFPGQLVLSLPETLCRAGVRTVLAGLWEVDDQVAISFMSRFYSYLKKFPRDEALRQTQLDWLNNRGAPADSPLEDYEKADTTAPFYWAGYTFTVNRGG